MVKNSLSIIWQGDLGTPESHTAKSLFYDTEDKAKSDTFRLYIKSNVTDCTVVSWAFIETEVYDAEKPDASANVDRAAVLVLRDNVYGTKSTYKVPCPKASVVSQEDAGERITLAAQLAFALSVETLTARAQTALQGYVVQVK